VQSDAGGGPGVPARILIMIPLRRAFIVKQHGHAEIPRGPRLRPRSLIVGESGGASASTVFTPGSDGIRLPVRHGRGGRSSGTINPRKKVEQFQGGPCSLCDGPAGPAGVRLQHHIGRRIASVTFACCVLRISADGRRSRLFVSGGTTANLPGTKRSPTFSSKDIRDAYNPLHGARAVAAGGLISASWQAIGR